MNIRSCSILLTCTIALLAKPLVVAYSYGTDPKSTAIDYSKITHLIGSFVKSDSLGNIRFDSWIPEDELLATLKKAEASGAIPMIALGTTDDGWKMTKSKSARAAFVQNIVAYCEKNGIKGVDLDLEGTAEEFNWGSPGTFFPAPYESLAVELRAALPKTHLLTAAVGSSPRSGAQWSDTFLKQLDFINVMIYDRALSWESSPVINHSTFDGQVEAANYWNTTRGLAKSKIMLGVPFYARGWDRDNNRIYMENPGWEVATWDYADFILRNTLPIDQDTLDFPATDSIKYPRKSGITGKGTLFFNSVGMIAKKTAWAVENGFGGMMIWHVAGDLPTSHNYSLLRAMDSVLSGSTKLGDESFNKKAVHAITLSGTSLRLHGVAAGMVQIRLYSLAGRELYAVSKEAQGREIAVPLTIGSGVYCLSVQGSGGESFHRIAIP